MSWLTNPLGLLGLFYLLQLGWIGYSLRVGSQTFRSRLSCRSRSSTPPGVFSPMSVTLYFFGNIPSFPRHLAIQNCIHVPMAVCIATPRRS